MDIVVIECETFWQNNSIEKRQYRIVQLFPHAKQLLVLLLILIGLLCHHRTVNRKQQAVEAQISAAAIARPVETLSGDELLFQQIEQLIKKSVENKEAVAQRCDEVVRMKRNGAQSLVAINPNPYLCNH